MPKSIKRKRGGSQKRTTLGSWGEETKNSRKYRARRKTEGVEGGVEGCVCERESKEGGGRECFAFPQLEPTLQ